MAVIMVEDREMDGWAGHTGSMVSGVYTGGVLWETGGLGLPSIRVFSNESALCIRWPKNWSFSFNISPSNDSQD